jgi:hypothetical protein
MIAVRATHKSRPIAVGGDCVGGGERVASGMAGSRVVGRGVAVTEVVSETASGTTSRDTGELCPSSAMMVTAPFPITTSTSAVLYFDTVEKISGRPSGPGGPRSAWIVYFRSFVLDVVCHWMVRLPVVLRETRP